MLNERVYRQTEFVCLKACVQVETVFFLLKGLLDKLN